MKILIIEDEAIVAMSLQFLLQSDGHVVTGIANDVAGTIQCVNKDLPDLALVDLQLAHGSSGFDVALALQNCGVPCFFLTGNVPIHASPGLALGCIQKPFSEEVLEAALSIAETHINGGAPFCEVPEQLIIY